MRNDATSAEPRDDRASFASRDSRAALGDAVLAGLSLPVWVFDFSGFAALRSASATDGDGHDVYARFLNDATIVATNPAAIAFHKATSAADLALARERIFSPAAVRAIAAASEECDANLCDLDIELGAMDGTVQRVRARLDRIANDADASYHALTILPCRMRANLLRAIPDIVYELDANGIYVDFAGPEDAWLVPSAFIGKSITETMPPDVAHRALAALNRLRERGGSERFEYALSMSDGLHWYEANMSALPSGGAAAHVRDVTELVSAEWRCQESEERSRMLDADLKARTLDLERAHNELEIARGTSKRPPPKSQPTPSVKTK